VNQRLETRIPCRKRILSKSDDGAISAYRRPEIVRFPVCGFAANFAALSPTRLLTSYPNSLVMNDFPFGFLRRTEFRSSSGATAIRHCGDFHSLLFYACVFGNLTQGESSGKSQCPGSALDRRGRFRPILLEQSQTPVRFLRTTNLPVS
jgi:hypothetical protein